MRTSEHASGWDKYDLVQFRRVSAIGAVFAALFFLASLTPSLAPRAPLVQGAASGLIAAIGYEIGLAIVWMWRVLQLSKPGIQHRQALRKAGWVCAVALSLLALAKVGDWHNATRAALGLPGLEEAHTITIAAVAICIFLLVWCLMRLFWAAVRHIETFVGRFVPPRLSLTFGILLGLFLFYSLLEGTAIRFALTAADTALETTDRFIDPETERPSGSMVSGGEDSLLSWNELGRKGRSFVATAPSDIEIAEFIDRPALNPIRVYVGRRSSGTSAERARLAVDELIRVGGFDREVLIVASPTGTGWMDPSAHDTLDFMMGGDIATVAVQFSYLNSPLALMLHPEYGLEQTRDLFEAVYDHWLKMPRDARPKLYVFGLSQGAFNTQSTVPLLDMLADPIHGALWVGSPFLSPIWQHVRDNRAPGSPAWRPQYGNGSLVRTLDQFNDVEGSLADWGPIRLIFLQYASDPIVVFTPDSAFRRPDWLRDQRAPDVSPALVWVPIVTMLQTALDMALAVQVEGFGHYYAPVDYARAWAELLQLEDWSQEGSAELAAIVHSRAQEN